VGLVVTVICIVVEEIMTEGVSVVDDATESREEPPTNNQTTDNKTKTTIIKTTAKTNQTHDLIISPNTIILAE
jgi:hypothetical protein